MSKSDIRKRLDELVSRVGMSHAVKRKAGTYSKGMQQRIGLATALISDPEVLFLDEPTDGLDPVGRKDVRVLLKEICETGKTVIVNSHLLHELELICDRVAVLQQGRLIALKATSELTQESQQLVFKLASITTQQFDQIKNLFGKIFKDEELTLQKKENAQGEALFEMIASRFDQLKIDCLVDLLRKEQVSIQSLSRQSQSLEEAFLDLIETEEGENDA